MSETYIYILHLSREEISIRKIVQFPRTPLLTWRGESRDGIMNAVGANLAKGIYRRVLCTSRVRCFSDITKNKKTNAEEVSSETSCFTVAKVTLAYMMIIFVRTRATPAPLISISFIFLSPFPTVTAPLLGKSKHR